MIFENVESVVLLITAIAAIMALVFNVYQIRRNVSLKNMELWLEFEKLFATHNEIDKKLRPGGKLNGGVELSVEEWRAVEDYMYLFVLCKKMMLDTKLIDQQTFIDIYKFRLANILSN